MTKHNISTRLLSMVMVICMMATMFAGITFASAEVGVAATSVVVGGVTLNAETPYLLETTANAMGFKASAATSEDGYVLHATFEDGTLTFNRGFALGTTDATWGEPGANWDTMIALVLDTTDNVYYGIKANGDLTIDTGSYNNFIYYDWKDNVKDRNNIGIFVDGNLTITGSGYIQVTSNPSFDVDNDNDPYASYGIKATGDVNLTGNGTVYVYEAIHSDVAEGDDTTTFISADGGDINLDGALLKFRASSMADARINHFEGTFNYDESAYSVTDGPMLVTSSGNNANGARGFVRGNYPSFGTPTTKSITYAPLSTLTFDVDGGSEVAAVIDEAGAVIDLSTYTTTKAGYDFLGWYLEDTFVTLATSITLAGDTTVYAKWEQSAKVETPATEIIYAGIKLNAETPYLLEDPSDSTNFNAIASATETAEGYALFAEFDPTTGTLTYHDGFTMSAVNGMAEPNFAWNSFATMAVPEGETTRYGIKANGELTIDLNGYNNALYATWSGDIENNNIIGIYAPGDITIQGDGFLRITGNPSKNHEDDSNAIYSAGDINLNGGTVYVYEGVTGGYTPVSGSKAVFFNARGDINLNGGSFKIRTQKNVTYTEKYNKAPIYDAENYVVSNDSTLYVGAGGHTNQSHGDVFADANYNGTTNISYTYTPKATLTFNTNGGSAIEAEKFAIGSVVNLGGYTTAMDGKIFAGWYADEALANKVTSITLTEDTTVYAKWRTPAGNATEVIYAGQKLNAETPYLFIKTWDSTGQHRLVVASDKETSADGGEALFARFDAETGTLTYIRGFGGDVNANALYPETVTGKVRPVWDETDQKYYGIKANGNLIIDMNGLNNAFKWSWNDMGSNMNVIDVAGDLTIKGEGKLSIHAVPGTDGANDNDPHKYSGAHHTNGIRADGNVTIEGGEVYLYARPNTNSTDDTTIFVNAGGDITLNGGALKMRSLYGMASYPTLTTSEPILVGNYKVDDSKNESLTESGGDMGYLFASAVNNPGNKTYAPQATLTFNTNGGSTIDAVTALKGSAVDLSEYTSTKDGEIFSGWYSDAEFVKRVTSVTLTENTTVYAKWRTESGPAATVWVADAVDGDGVILDATNKYLVLTNAGDTSQLNVSASDSLPVDETRLLATFDAETGTFKYNRGYKLVNGETSGNTFVESLDPYFMWNSQLYTVVPTGLETAYGLMADGNLIVDLNGFDNMIYTHWTGAIENNNSVGIYADGNVTITDSGDGTGSLMITATPSKNNANDSNAIMAEGDIIFEGQDNNLTPLNGAEALYFNAGNEIKLTGGAVSVRTPHDKLYQRFNVEPDYDADMYQVINKSNRGVSDTVSAGRARGTTKYVDWFKTNSAD